MAEPSYSGLVFKTAWKNTIAFFKHLVRDIFFGIGSFVIGALPFIGLYGADALKEEFVRFLAFVFAPGGIFLLFVFLWNLCLASDELVYGEIKRVSQQLRDLPAAPQPPARPATRPPSPIHWAVWRECSVYTVEEFAKILAKVDPVALSLPNDAATFQRLIIEDIATHKLSAVAQTTTSWDGRKVRLDHGSGSEIKRQDALAWAKSKQFAVDHVE